VVDVSYSSPFTVTLEGGHTLIADSVVIATHHSILDRSGHFATMSPSKSYCVAMVRSDESKPLMQLPGGYISTGKETSENISLRSAMNGNVLIVAGAGHTVGEASSLACYESLVSFARREFPAYDTVYCQWSSMDYYPADDMPYIGLLHHGASNIFLATGFQKWGFTTGTAAGTAIAEMILRGKAPKWAIPFDSRRWDLTHSTLKILDFMGHVGKHFVGKRLVSYANAMDIEELDKGCGGICKKNGELCAAYRKYDGTLQIVSHTCSHLGCQVTFNDADKQWECPCHGSVFDTSGNLLHGPAVKPLAKI
jgi:nitrite reductase/ring-hydroxylating ferredoxin subunit